MIKRYARSKMTQIWSLENQYASWLEVEIAVVAAWNKQGHVPDADYQLIANNANFNVARIAEIEATTRHDMVAFTRNVSESLGAEKKWIHYGLTSTDVVDTAQGLRLKQANKIILADLEKYRDVIGEMAVTYKNTVMMGRTHGVHAEPTTFGLKIARFYAEALRNIERFKRTAKAVETGKLSGAVGTFANVPMEVEEFVMNKLGLNLQPIGSQILPRDLHADYINSLGLIATSLENFATEIRSLQRSEIHEVEENFGKGQKGSSAMPHKRNPIGSENITGLARVVRGHMQTAMEDITLWHERDISHSGAERIILPDTTILVDYMLHRFTNILENLAVFPETMQRNMQRTYGLIYSQRLLLKLIDAGLSRELAYDTVQPLTAKSWDEQIQFRPLVEKNKIIQQYLTSADIADAFDYSYHLKNVDAIFARLGLVAK
ncbi:adenylosuccinate lyase [Periweissella beninensis]|uniref:Adenylosuccinate lyase n=1 Tax=Periweissella beninensis TaxID=504936 RepID=A0ABT0VFA5_9LACO|nr:adenylosuccinate lyase [Periweissella beninensis]MBM7543547.1 adenylosuccinate lyase [Periweissella beninensis]MCM2436529.1 adenylosuccinate lyase [Periweissella beninensis]MCT4396246.1 adenylosuccinate lyase [Periweissella beninensis]